MQSFSMHGKMDLDMLDSKRDEVMSILVSCFCMKKACLFGGFLLINTLHTYENIWWRK